MHSSNNSHISVLEKEAEEPLKVGHMDSLHTMSHSTLPFHVHVCMCTLIYFRITLYSHLVLIELS